MLIFLFNQEMSFFCRGFFPFLRVLPLKIVFLMWLSVFPSAQGAENVPPLSYRTWTSDDGRTVEAAFILLNQNQVVLKDRDDQRISIAMQRLSWRDQVMARRLAGQPGIESPAAAGRLVPRGRRASQARVYAAFGEDCLSLLTDAIGDARREILIAIYTMTSTPIRDALLEAANRGVRIHIKYDEKQVELGRMREILADLAAHRSVTTTPIRMSGRFASMHHKFAVFDQSAVFTGSFNFTVAGTNQNYENAVLIYSDTIAGEFTKEFEAIESR
jgi:phosphatidylserine/phosphatidylglycerophosphate/cardiolipin synthase-like enzyme